MLQKKQKTSLFLRNGETVTRRNGDKSVKRFLVKKNQPETLDFVECQVVNIAIVSSLTKLERGSIEMLKVSL